MDEITNGQVTETQPTNTEVEENTQTSQEPQSNQQEAVDTNVENSNGETQVENEDGTQKTEDTVTQEPTNEELKARLKEYEVKEEEDRLLREKLGLKDIDPRSYDFMNVEQQIINEGKQRYLRLCTEYGVDANPDRIDQSIEELKKTDPAKGYEFLHKFESLGNEVSYKRQQVQQEVSSYEISKFVSEYNQLLDASPALQNIVSTYVNSYGATGNLYNQLENVMNVLS